MKNIRLHTTVVVIAILVAASGFVVAHSSDTASQSPLRYQENSAFGFGETLRYKVGYKFMTAGYATFAIGPEPVMYNGAKCYDVRFVVKSLESLDFLYKVRDTYRSLVDVHGIFPWRFEQHIREGRYKRDFVADLDHRKEKAFVKDTSYSLQPFTHDIVSAMYYVRSLSVEKMYKGDTVQLRNFYKDSTYSLAVAIRGHQQIEVEAGTFDCVIVEPIVKAGGLFKSESNILVWLTRDERKIPVRVRTKVLIGNIDAELIGTRGLRVNK